MNTSWTCRCSKNIYSFSKNDPDFFTVCIRVTSIYRDFKLNVFKCISSCCIWSVFGACVSYCGQNTWLYSKACSILITKSSFCNSWKYTTFFVSSLFTVNFFSYSIFFEQIMTLQCCTMLLFLYQPNYTTMFYFTFCVPACRLLWSKKLYSIVHDCIDVTSTNNFTKL